MSCDSGFIPGIGEKIQEFESDAQRIILVKKAYKKFQNVKFRYLKNFSGCQKDYIQPRGPERKIDQSQASEHQWAGVPRGPWP
jgi:hypothetical protein